MFGFRGTLSSRGTLFAAQTAGLLTRPSNSLGVILTSKSRCASTTSLLTGSKGGTVRCRFKVSSIVLSPGGISCGNNSCAISTGANMVISKGRVSFAGAGGPSKSVAGCVNSNV